MGSHGSGTGVVAFLLLLTGLSTFAFAQEENFTEFESSGSESGSGFDDGMPIPDYLDKFELGMSANNIFPICLKRRLDGVSKPIYIPNGFPIGGSTHNRAYVGTNGIISFERGFYYWYPSPFPTRWWNVRKRHVVAPFWSDNDIRISGSVCYEVHEENTDYLSLVNEYISKEANTSFKGTWMILAEWDDVHPYPHGSRSSWWWWWYSSKFKDFTNLKNSYQAIVVTDGITSYSLFTYKCNEMQWSGYWRHATVGFNAAGDLYRNHPLTGYHQVKEIGCHGSKSNKINNVIYAISLPPDFLQKRRAECLNLLKEDEEKFGDILDIFYNLQPCPCSRWQSWRDRRFRRDWNAQYSGSSCYQERFPRSNKGSQYCCYKRSSPGWGSLQHHFEAGEYGTSMLLFHPRRYTSEYLKHDRKLREACCKPAAVGLCDRYYERRPQNNCRNYRPPPWSWGWGDPHISTLDTSSYTFNGLGEYRMVEINTSSVSFKMHGRTDKIGSNVNATEFVALAFSVPNESIEIQNVNSTFVVYHNLTLISEQLANINDTYSNTDETIELTRLAENSLEIVFENGISVTVNVSVGLLHYTIAMPEEFQGMTNGLLGNFNGNSNDDFISPNGTSYNSSNEKEVFKFGESWKVSSASESLFVLADPDPDPSFVPDFVEDVLKTASSEILDACGSDLQCIYDAVQTNNISIGLTTSGIQQNLTNDALEFNNFPPVMTGAPLIEVTANELTTYNFNASDNDSFTVNVDAPQLVNGYTLEEGSGGWTFKFTWTLNDTKNFTFTLIATDSFDVSSILQPRVSLCGCTNGGNCSYDGLSYFTNPVTLPCECDEEVWSGEFCEVDVDGCDDFMCFPGVTCKDNAAPMSGATCGNCPLGYFGDGFICDDIDECENASSNACEQICINTEGSYFCECFSGYSSPFENGTNCEDNNECASYNECHQVCVNTDGSYKCSCKKGFILKDDNRSCKAEIPCKNVSSSDKLLCAVVEGSNVYDCIKGYTLTDDNMCEDVNECQLTYDVCDSFRQNCINTDGYFNCSCKEGFSPSNEDSRSCYDINECVEAALRNEVLCNVDQLCVNVPGNYSCTCPEGTVYDTTSDSCQTERNVGPMSTTKTTVLSATSSSSISSSSRTRQTTTPSVMIERPSSVLSTEAIVGIAVGSAVFVLVLFVIIGVILCKFTSSGNKVIPKELDAKSEMTQREGGRKEFIKLVSVTSQDQIKN